VYIRDYFDLQQAEPEMVRAMGTNAVRRPIQAIEFRSVSFRYPRTDKWVLKDINLTFRRGERIGLVGENGAGKTSLVKLLCRLYDPTEGAICVDGVDLRELEIDKWHETIGVIFQDFVTYADRVRDNIGYGQVEELDNLPRIVEAAKKGQAHDFIQKMPEGYETMLGREFARGEWLSGGQLQRLALSRLFMRDADVLILDEPTFALDPRSEYDIYETCNEHCVGKISLLISHRFSTMRIADRIIVLGGQVLEEGTHGDLVRLGGRYAQLYEIQSRVFR
jgi:ATP-binding cassette subfamily B protein